MYKLGNSDAIVINDLDIKNKIIDYIFNSIDLSKFRYNMLDNIQKLNYLKNNPHYVSPNYKGYNYFVLFIKINGSNYCCVIDKKKLSYHRDKINIKSISIFRVKVSTSNSIFRGTLFDTKLIRKNGVSFMLIKGLYYDG